MKFIGEMTIAEAKEFIGFIQEYGIDEKKDGCELTFSVSHFSPGKKRIEIRMEA